MSEFDLTGIRPPGTDSVITKPVGPVTKPGVNPVPDSEPVELKPINLEQKCEAPPAPKKGGDTNYAKSQTPQVGKAGNGVNVSTFSPTSQLSLLEKEALLIYGESGVESADLVKNPYFEFTCSATEEAPKGTAKVLDINGEKYLIVEEMRDGKPRVGIRSESRYEFIWMEELGAKDLLTGDGGDLVIEWTEKPDGKGGANNNVKMKYVSAAERLKMSLTQKHGMGNVDFAYLTMGEIELPFTHNKEGAGKAYYFNVDGKSHAISETVEAGKRTLTVMSEYNQKTELFLKTPGEHLISTPDGGLLKIDWSEKAPKVGEPYGSVELSHIEGNKVQSYFVKSAAEGKGFYKGKNGYTFEAINAGEKIYLPKKVCSFTNLAFGLDHWEVIGVDGKISHSKMESSFGKDGIYYDASVDSSTFGKPRSDHPFKVTPEGDVYLVHDGVIDGTHPVKNGKPSFHMGECFSNGAFNVLGGAMVVVGSETISEITGEEVPHEVEAAIGMGTFYAMAASMESAAAPGAVDWLAFNSNFAKATPGALAVGMPIFYGSGLLVNEAGVDPMSFEGKLATSTIGGVTLAATLNATLPGFLTVGSYTTGASLMSAGAIAEVGVAGTATILLGEGLLVLGAGAAGYGFGTVVVDPVGGDLIYSIEDETPYSDGTLSGWIAEDEWNAATFAATVALGPVAGLYVYGAKKLAPIVAENHSEHAEEEKAVESKPDPFDRSGGPFTSIW